MDTNISRAEVQARSAMLEVTSYVIEVDLRDVAESATFGSVTAVRFSCREPGSCTWIDLIAEAVHSAELNGVALDVSDYAGARLALPDLAAENELIVRASCRYMNTGEGLHRSVDPSDGAIYLYTQFATAEARRVFACFEQPDLKARFTWEVVAPAAWRVLSNSLTPDPAPVADEGRADTSVAELADEGPAVTGVVELADEGPAVTSATELADEGPADTSDPELARWRFAATPPLPTYLTALCAGPFAAFEGEYAGAFGTYPLGIFTRDSMAAHLDADEFLAVTRAGLAHYEQIFERPYPFAKYDQVCVPEFNLGAMENPGLVTFREELTVFRSKVTEATRETRAMIALHEMAHMWFGDLVTMRWWDDVWLNESFATWGGFGTTATATRFTEAWTAFALAQKAWAYRQDQLPSTHPISADMVDLEAVYLSFDGITYAKGASVLKQLVAYVGREPFLAGLRRYFAAHEWGNATLADLLAELSAASGRDLDAWAQVWLELPGVTTLRPVVEIDEAGRYRRVAVEQLPATRPAGVPDTLRPHRVAVGAYRWTDIATAEGSGPAEDPAADSAGRATDRAGHATDPATAVHATTSTPRLVRAERIELDVTDAVAEVPELTGLPAAPLLIVNDDDLTYAKLDLDPTSLATALDSVGLIDDSLTRALVWGALWERVRDGKLPAQQFVSVALAGLADEPRPGIIDSVFGWVRTAVTQYVAPTLRPQVAVQACEASAALLEAAAPGSDRQLSLLMAHIQSAVQPIRLATLADLLAERTKLPGLNLDDELRWAIVLRLAGQGFGGAELIDSVLAADRTSSGEKSAARARAAIPTARAKQEAWNAALTGGLPNTVLEATVRGFSDPECPAELLSPYRPRYFAQIAQLFADRSPSHAQALAVGLFPHAAPATVTGARALLADPDLPSGLRRIVAESCDEVERALACQEVSRAAG